MMYLPAHRLRIYRDFMALATSDHYGIVRYYERHEEAIQGLEPEVYFDCTLIYLDALFDTGEYGKYTVMCDLTLELMMHHNFDRRKGEDLFTLVLRNKARAQYLLHNFEAVAHITRELVKIDPNDRTAVRLLFRALVARRPAWLIRTRALGIVLVLLAALVIALELLVVEPFFSDWYNDALWTHNLLFCGGIAVMVIGESVHQWRCEQAVAKAKRKL
jgi:hypothetical protein